MIPNIGNYTVITDLSQENPDIGYQTIYCYGDKGDPSVGTWSIYLSPWYSSLKGLEDWFNRNEDLIERLIEVEDNIDEWTKILDRMIDDN